MNSVLAVMCLLAVPLSAVHLEDWEDTSDWRDLGDWGHPEDWEMLEDTLLSLDLSEAALPTAVETLETWVRKKRSAGNKKKLPLSRGLKKHLGTQVEDEESMDTSDAELAEFRLQKKAAYQECQRRINSYKNAKKNAKTGHNRRCNSFCCYPHSDDLPSQ